MANFNKIIVDGRLGADPEMRYTPSGTAVTSFRLANSQYDAQAENKEHTTWYRVSIFGKRAETANEHLAKGSRVLVSGSHRIREYDKDGETRQSNEILADDFTFLDSKRDSAPVERSAAPSKPAQRPARNVPRVVDDTEDLPF